MVLKELKVATSRPSLSLAINCGTAIHAITPKTAISKRKGITDPLRVSCGWMIEELSDIQILPCVFLQEFPSAPVPRRSRFDLAGRKGGVERVAFAAFHHARSLRFDLANDPVFANDEIMTRDGTAGPDCVNAVGLFRNAGR